MHRLWLLVVVLDVYLQQSSGCVGGCVKPPPVTTSEKHGRKQKSVKKGGRGHSTHPPRKEWWTSSSNEMESNSTNPRSTQRSASTVSTPNHSQDGRPAGNNSSPTFVNHALMLWNERRREWVGNRPRHRPNQTREPVISTHVGSGSSSRGPSCHYLGFLFDLFTLCGRMFSWSTTYEDLLATSRPFPQPVPLPEMVDFLVDVWEQEGLYE